MAGGPGPGGETDVKRCHRCRKELIVADRVGRTETCSSCGADLRCCKNCAFHDAGSYNQCREPQAERVLEKERGNFCDYFMLADASRNGRVQVGKADVKGRRDALFKK